MQAKPRALQGDLYSVRLYFLCNKTHPLVRLSKVIDWSQFDEVTRPPNSSPSVKLTRTIW